MNADYSDGRRNYSSWAASPSYLHLNGDEVGFGRRRRLYRIAAA